MNTNVIVLLGNLGKDPEMKVLGDKTVTKFSIAVESYKKDETDWFNIQAWGKTAEFVGNSVKKGAKVCITGRLGIDKWTDKVSGEMVSRPLITANTVDVVLWPKDGGSGGGQSSRGSSRPSSKPAAPAPAEEDDIPF